MQSDDLCRLCLTKVYLLTLYTTVQVQCVYTFERNHQTLDDEEIFRSIPDDE